MIYMAVDDQSHDNLLEKIIDLGHLDKARHVWGCAGFEIYSVEMSGEDLTMLKLSVPFIEIEKCAYGTD